MFSTSRDFSHIIICYVLFFNIFLAGFCEELGDRNVWATLFELNEELINKDDIILVTAKVWIHYMYIYFVLCFFNFIHTSVLVFQLFCRTRIL